MLFYTHLVFSFLIALYSIDFLGIDKEILFILLVLFFGILPDIDEFRSRIGRKLNPISFFIKVIFGHRGIFHAVWFPIVLGVLLLFILEYRVLGMAVIVGYLSHLFLDLLTLKGIKPLYPFFDKKIRGFVKVGSIFENVIFVFIVVLIVLKLM